jgi:hypothetical protein
MNKGLGMLISGFGDYKVEANTLLTGGLDPPTVVNSVNNGSVIVRHREYLQDINASIPFTITPLNLNPGLIGSFPWLSAIAQHFEQYRFRGLLFEFKSLSSDAVLSAATSSALGSIVMATQYNALNPTFPDKFTMENYEFANSSKPSISFIHPVECAGRDTTISELYVRSGANPAGSDIRLYDLGVFNIASVGMQASSGVAGELWCTYEIELIKPKISNPIGADIGTDHFILSTAATNPQPFLNATGGIHNSIGGTLATNIYNFPVDIVEGTYLCTWTISSAVSAVTVVPTVNLTNCTLNLLFNNNGSASYGTFGAAFRSTMTVVVNVATTNASIAFNLGIYPLPLQFGDFVITELPSNISLLEVGDITMHNSEDSFTDSELYDLIARLQKMGVILPKK